MTDVAEVVALARGRSPTLGRSRLVCVDGPAGSGKTTLATELESEFLRRGLVVATLHMDDLYAGWSGLDEADHLQQRVLDQVMLPLAASQPGRWQRYDWHAQRFAEWHHLPPPDLLIIDGCGSGALAYAPYLTVLVWVQAARDTRIARGVDRDGEAVLPQWLRWMDSEERHFVANRTRERADVQLWTG